VVIVPVLWLLVKTLDLTVSMVAALCVVTLLWASSWSLGDTWYRFIVVGDKFWFSVFIFSLSLICFVRGSPHHLISVRPLWLYL
jgi:hypothetical protein